MWSGLTTSTLEIPPSVPPVPLCMEGLCAPVTSGGLGGPCEIFIKHCIVVTSHIIIMLICTTIPAQVVEQTPGGPGRPESPCGGGDTCACITT